MKNSKFKMSSRQVPPQGCLCPQCEDEQAFSSMHEEEYVYGRGESAVRLWVKIPVYTCNKCKFQFTDWEAAEIKHNALCRHFGVLTPSDIVQIRKSYEMTRSEFAQITGLGEASLSRWEKGINIQSMSHDRFLRLLRNPATFQYLKRTVKNINCREQNAPNNIVPISKGLNINKAREEQRSFKLRAAI